MSGHEVRRMPHPDLPEHEAIVLVSPDGLTATFVPTVGMVGSSLTDDGVELLGQRGGIVDYLARGKTFGIPLLAPWANRLGATQYEEGGQRVVLVAPDGAAVPGLHTDAAGLPMHGLFTSVPDWVVIGTTAGAHAAALHASLDHSPSSPRFPGFPFEHRLDVAVTLAGRVLTVTTSLTATGEQDVPVCFGWHPYLAPPDVPREEWVVHPASVRRALLDDRSIPTGALVEDPTLAGPLADRTFDDLLADVPDGAVGSVQAGARRISVTSLHGYPWAVLYAPASPDVVCLEVMTAPTDPFAGTFAARHPLVRARPGGPAVVATFTVTVDTVPAIDVPVPAAAATAPEAAPTTSLGSSA